MTASRSTTFATTMRVIYRVHRSTANRRTNAAPARCTGFAELAQVVLTVGNLAQRRTTFGQHFAHFAGAQTQSGVLTFARHQLSRSPGATGHLRTLARLHFNTVNRATERHIAQRQSVPRLDRRVITGLNLIASLNTFRRNDVTTLTIGIQNQRDERGTV